MKKILFVLILAFVSFTGFAQKVDFSGKWKINKEKSELGDERSMAPNNIILVQGDNSLSVERHSTWQGQERTSNDKFTLDGKECENPGWRDSIKKSTAVWTENGKVLKITTKIPMRDGGEMSINEDYKMEGKNLVVLSSRSSSFGNSSEKFVFDKE